MIALTDIQLETVMTLARELEPEKRAAYLQRFAAELGRHSGRINNANVRLRSPAWSKTPRREKADMYGALTHVRWVPIAVSKRPLRPCHPCATWTATLLSRV